MSPKQCYRVERLKAAAERETATVLKSLPPAFRERVKAISIRFEDKPTPKMIEDGVPEDAFSVTNRECKELTVFLMNLFDRHGKEPGEFNMEFRNVLSRELSEWTGEKAGEEE